MYTGSRIVAIQEMNCRRVMEEEANGGGSRASSLSIRPATTWEVGTVGSPRPARVAEHAKPVWDFHVSGSGLPVAHPCYQSPINHLPPAPFLPAIFISR